MLEINEYDVKPGVYEYQGNAYVVKNVVTHTMDNGKWIKLAKPYVIMEHLQPQYEGDKQKHVCMGVTLKVFKALDITGKPLFKPL